MTETIRTDYEVSMETSILHWPIPYARMEDTTPTETFPASVLSRVKGTEMTGTILTLDAGDSKAVVDFTPAMVYKHDIRNVLTYSGAAEATFGAINVGDTVYYDRSSTMPAGVKLSTSPLDKDGVANPIFGRVVQIDDTDGALYPKGTTSASTQYAGVAQKGAG
jgi:hypothetical protein